MSDKFLKALIYIIIFSLLIIFLLIQPFNLICKISNKCQPIILSSYLWNKKGEKEIFINFKSQISEELKNIVEFYPEQKFQEIISGKNIINFYKVKNLTDQKITIQAHYNISPEKADKYLNRIECLCFQRQLLEAGQEVKMKINFVINSDIEKDKELKNLEEININYDIFLIPNWRY